MAAALQMLRSGDRLKQEGFFWCDIEKPQRGGIMVAPGKADERGRNPGLNAPAFKKGASSVDRNW